MEVLLSSEVDQVLECEIQITMYRVMIWVQDGLITIPTTRIIRSRIVSFVNLERHTYKRRHC